MRFVLMLSAAAAVVAIVAPGAVAAPQVQTVVLTIRPMPHAALTHSVWHDVKARLAPDERVDGSNFAVRPGITVRVVVWNYTQTVHSFDSPGLHVNAAILPGSSTHPVKSVFTFEPRTYGRVTWYCSVPCGGYMGGNVYVLGD